MSVQVRIVIPCFDEEGRFDAPRFDAFLSTNPEIGFVLVNDGSRDGTLEVLRRVAGRWPDRVQVLDQQPNQGKAEAVRKGMVLAMGDGVPYVGYWDADLATPLEAIPELAAVLDRFDSVDVVLGARVALLGRRIVRKASRHYLGRMFATAASVTLDLPVYDTQCGAKMIRNTDVTRSLFDEPFGSRWIFDVELLARYLSHPGVADDADGIYEHPLREWRDVGESKVKPADFVRAFGEMAAIYRAYPLQKTGRGVIVPLLGPFARYVAAGGVGTTLHYVTLAVLVELLGIASPVATVVGATLGALTNYLLNYYFTFASRLTHRRTLPRFLAVAGLGVSLNGFGMWLGVSVLGFHYLATQVACTASVLVVGYFLNKLWSFADRRGGAADAEPDLSVPVDRLADGPRGALDGANTAPQDRAP